MSMLIKGMDMPEHCYECLLRQGNCCLLLYEAVPPTVPLKRLADCPLVEIPTPHGRIIDEDEIFKRPHCGECNDATLDAINNAPTILEAEER